MINDLISREALKKVISDAYEKYDGYEPNDLGRFAEMVDEAIDNAPTVEPYTENDVIEGIRAGYKDGYEAAKAKFERPQEVNCSLCDYFKFSQSFIKNVVEMMLKYNIESVEDLKKELNHIIELLGGRE